MYSSLNHDAYLKLLDEHAIVSTTDASGTIIECNDKFCEISGYSRSELIGQSHRVLKSGIHPASYYEKMWSALVSGNTWQGEVCNRRKNGSHYWVEASITPVLDKNGLPFQYISIRTDITAIKEMEHKFNLELVNSLPGIFYMLSPSSHFLLWNDRLEEVLQSSHDEIAHSRILDFFDGADRNLFENTLCRAFEAGDLSVDAVIKARDGTRTPYHFTGKPIIRDGQSALIGLGIDITGRKQAEEESRRSNEELAAIFDSSKVSIVYIRDHTMIKSNRKFEEVFGYAPGELIGQATRKLYPDEQSHTSVVSGSALIMARGKSYHRVMEMQRKDGTRFWARLSGSALSADLSRGSVWTCEDVTAEHQARERIHTMAFYDALTQLPNRRMLEDRLSQALAHSKRRHRYGALMFLDLDNFKPLNDKHGHTAGDLLLVEVARRISQCVREVDTVARFGGDEFVVMINELDEDEATSASQAAIVAEKIRILLSEPYSISFSRTDGMQTILQHHCSSSIGLVLFSDQSASQEDILEWADMAMYEAKGSGRNRVCCFDPRTSRKEKSPMPQGMGDTRL
ncbi:MAG TPA: PAS domain S-box protein [Gallionella sp.]